MDSSSTTQRRPGQATRLISAALIVRNEAERLPAVVAAARRFADEVVICDTGATDRTPTIARDLGCRLTRYRWSHDYAAARNASFQACRGRYIVWLDPDEEIPAEDAPELRAIAEEGAWDQVRCPTYLGPSYRPAERDLPGYGPGFEVWKPRMIRRDARMRWRWRVHEEIEWAKPHSQTDRQVRVFNHGQAGDQLVEDYYIALMVIGHREEPDAAHYSLYLAEAALVRDHSPAKALAYSEQVDPGHLGSDDQREKFWLTVARAHKMLAVAAFDRGSAPEAQQHGSQAMAAFAQAHEAAGGVRPPLEAATLLLHTGQREKFDRMVDQALAADPASMQAGLLKRLSAGQPNDQLLNTQVGYYLALQRGRTPMEALEMVVGASGRWTGPVNLRVVIPARAREDAPLRRRNLEVCLRSLSAAADALGAANPEAQLEVVVVEQDAEPGLRELASAGRARHLHYPDGGPFNRGECFNRGAEIPTGNPVDGPEFLVLLDGDIWLPPDWLTKTLNSIAGWRQANAWHGAALPYTHACYLHPEPSEQVAAGTPPGPPMRWGTFNSVGGALWIEPELYRTLGGHDADYAGWGSEDRDMMARLIAATGGRPPRVPQPLWHLHHEQPDRANADANRARFKRDHPNGEG